jgi:hypothetical protein
MTGEEFGLATVARYIQQHPGALHLVWSNPQQSVIVYRSAD